MDIYTLEPGTAPLVISLPHEGTALPAGFAQRLTPEAAQVPDTDWWVARLYAFARELGASILVPRYSRYVVDLNRGENDASLYPGQNTTGLCPMVQFSGAPVYLPGMEPTAEEVRERLRMYWRPYHSALASELSRLRATHGRVVLWEGHSIRSQLPFLFEGRLPDLNLGTAAGASCSPQLQARLEAVLGSQQDYSVAVNGRFKGGYITRHYGDPANGVDAVQLELAQCTYMDEHTVCWDDAKAERVQAVLRALLIQALR